MTTDNISFLLKKEYIYLLSQLMKGFPLPSLDCVKDSLLLMADMLKDCDIHQIEKSNKDTRDLIYRVVESITLQIAQYCFTIKELINQNDLHLKFI